MCEFENTMKMEFKIECDNGDYLENNISEPEFTTLKIELNDECPVNNVNEASQFPLDASPSPASACLDTGSRETLCLSNRSSKRNILSLEKKIRLIEEIDKNERPRNEIAEHYGISLGAISSILGNRDKIIEAHTSNNFHLERSTVHGKKYEHLENKLLKWISKSSVLINETTALEKASKYAEEVGIDDFIASTEWLEGLKKTHNLDSLQCGENVQEKRKVFNLTLEKKVELIAAVEKGDKSRRVVAKKFGIAPSTLTGIMLNKPIIMEAFYSRPYNPARKKMRKPWFEDLESELLKCVTSWQADNIPFNGPKLLEKANEIARKLEITDFSGSSGWIDRFKSRNNISCIPGCEPVHKFVEGKKVKRKVFNLTLEKKVELIAAVEKGDKSRRDLSKTFGIAPSTLTGIMLNKTMIMEAFHNQTYNPERRKFRKPCFGDLDRKLLKCVLGWQADKIPFNGPKLIEKANEIAKELEIKDFSGSNGWIDRFKSRNNIRCTPSCEWSKEDRAIRRTKTLTMDKKIELLEQVEKGKKSKKQIAKQFGIAPSTLSGILLNRKKIINQSNCSKPRHKKIRKSFHRDVEDVITQLKENGEHSSSMDDTELLTKAVDIAEERGLDNFCSSNSEKSTNLQTCQNIPEDTNDSQLSSIISSDDSAPPTPDISDSTSNDVPSITKQIYNSMEGRPEFQNIFKKHKCRDQYRKYTQEQLMEACKYAIETRASYREVSEKFGIPQSTLRDKLHAVEKLNNDGQPPTKKARVDTPQITEPESTVVLCPEIPDNDLSRGSNGTNDRSNYRQYSKDSLMTAAHYVMKFNTPIMKAARMFGVPASTLKDHVKNKMTGSQETVAPPTTPSLISDRDERKLIEYIKMMEKCGFILTQKEIIDFGSELASTSREIDGSITLSDSWYLDFVKRWPPLGLVNRERRNSTPQDTKKYFTELNKVFNKHKFFERPELVYVLEEVDIALECNPLKLVPRKRFQKSKGTQQTLTSIIGCSNALGTSLPPYYVLQSDEVVADVISQCPPGTQATFANSASKDCSIVRDYFQNHFMRFAQSGRNTQNRFVLVFYDSRKSNFNVSDLEWAKRWHILLHPLPHPVNKDNEETMDGIFQNYCTDVEEARLKFVDEKGYMAVSMPDICGILGKAYRRSLTYEHIVSCFENFGIYPLNPQKYVAQLEPSFQVKLQDLHAVANYETNLWLLSDFGCTQAVNNVIESSLNSSYTSDSNNQNSFYQNENSSKYIGQMNKSDMINPSGSRYNQETASFNTSGLVNQLLEQCVGINPQEPLMNGMAIKTEPQMDLSYGQITGESQNQNHFNYQLSESYMTDQSRSVNTPNILSVPQFPRIQTVQTSDMSSTENTSLALSSQTGLDESQEQPFISSQITPNSKTKHESSSSSRRKGKSHRVIVNEPNNENSATPAAESSNPSTADNSTPSTESNIIFCKSKVDNNRKASKLGSLLDEKVRKLHEQAKASNESIDDTDEPLMKVGEFQIVMNKGD